MAPMIQGPYGIRDPYCHSADPSKIGTMRSVNPWRGYCAPKMFMGKDKLFHVVQWRLNVDRGEFWYVYLGLIISVGQRFGGTFFDFQGITLIIVLYIQLDVFKLWF